MTTYKGVVKDHIVVLEDGAQLPDGAEVEVRLLEPSFRRDDVFAHVLANRITHDSPEPSLRPLPATGHAAEILDV